MSARGESTKLRKRSGSVGQTIEFRAGFIVGIEFSATGGVAYEREEIRSDDVGEGLEAEFKTVKQIDNRELVKQSKSIVAGATYIMDRFCTHTPIGYFADDETLPTVEKEIAPFVEASKLFNEIAQLSGSKRKVRINIFPLSIRLDNEASARRLAETVRERLEAVRDTLAAGDRKEFEAALDRCRNLHKLATGMQSSAIELAIENAKELKKELLHSIREGKSPAEAGKALDLETLEAAISYFPAIL